MKNTILITAVLGLFLASCGNKTESNSSEAGDVANATVESEHYSIEQSASTISWHGEKITGDEHNGSIKIKDGALEIEGDVIKAGHIEIDMTTIVSTDEMPEDKLNMLAGHLRSAEFFDAEQFPTARFDVSSVSSDSMFGNLTIKGVTRSIGFPYDLIKANDQVTARAEMVFNRAEFDVRYGSGSFFDDLGDNLIKDEVRLTTVLVAVKAEELATS